MNSEPNDQRLFGGGVVLLLLLSLDLSVELFELELALVSERGISDDEELVDDGVLVLVELLVS